MIRMTDVPYKEARVISSGSSSRLRQGIISREDNTLVYVWIYARDYNR